MTGSNLQLGLLVSAVLWLTPHSLAGAPQSGEPVFGGNVSRLLGIYESASPRSGLAPSPATLEALPLTAAAAKAQSAAVLGPDPKDLCQVLGPFRYMARPDVKFEILRDPPNKLVVVFENSSWGHLRTVALDALHRSDLAKARPLWNGDSVASWNGDTLEVDSIHFTNRTWLNEAGVTNSKQLHLIEHFRLLAGGKVLEYRATAVDPEVLAEPVSYTRYFERTSREIQDYDCLAHKPAAAPHNP